MNPDKPVKECVCRNCGNLFQGEVAFRPLGGRPREWWPTECPGCEAEDEKQRQEYLVQARREERVHWRQQSGMPEGLIDRTFENFETGWQDKALKTCRKYAEKLKLDETRNYRSLILYSPSPGVGKTHLMIAIANCIIDRWEGEPGQIIKPIGFESGPGLVRRIRATYHLRHEDNKGETEMDIYNELRGVRLLMLDDAGKEKPSDFTRELYWYLVNERVSCGLPVVMTCRLPLEGKDSLTELMGVDTVDRLYGMTGGHIEVLEGPSYRKSKRVA
jgi:DNA replication protein DnaC